MINIVTAPCDSAVYDVEYIHEQMKIYEAETGLKAPVCNASTAVAPREKICSESLAD
jgi:hypothetical protein